MVTVWLQFRLPPFQHDGKLVNGEIQFIQNSITIHSKFNITVTLWMVTFLFNITVTVLLQVGFHGRIVWLLSVSFLTNLYCIRFSKRRCLTNAPCASVCTSSLLLLCIICFSHRRCLTIAPWASVLSLCGSLQALTACARLSSNWTRTGPPSVDTCITHC